MRNWRFNHIDFSTFPHYHGSDLGVLYGKDKTTVRLWAPTAHKVEMVLYEKGKGGKVINRLMLTGSVAGTWTTNLEGDFAGVYYTFRVNDGEWLNEVPDPYARATGVNGHRGMIVDLRKTDPPGWECDKKPRWANFTDWIIYELHVRDFSSSPHSGMEHRGRFLAFAEENTFSPDGKLTGIAHLKELGITHVHFLPLNDYYTVDEENPGAAYNWGYDPQHFNVPEGSYSTNPYDGEVRIREMKQMIMALHSQGIGVIMDVVYNHTGLIRGSVFNQTVPGYYYRQNPDGSFSNASGCGNELATERSMVRKYIIDSLKYWIEEYHIDGFRFDLMGIYDLDTMRAIRAEINAIDKGIFIYGEGWAADASPMPEAQRAVKANIHLLDGIAAFSDDMRDALKGHHGQKGSRGFISGLALREEAVKFGIVAATWHPQLVYGYVESSHGPWANEPGQCVNYASCHDNFTLWDKLKLGLPQATESELKKMMKLAGAIILTSQGVPFLHAGVEFCRTKGGHGNSYNAPDHVNQLDWTLKTTFADVFDYFRQLIGLRKNHPVFRLETSELIRRCLVFSARYQPGVIAYTLNGDVVGDAWKEVMVVFNGNSHKVKIQLPGESYLIIARESDISETGLGFAEESEIEVAPVSMLLLARV